MQSWESYKYFHPMSCWVWLMSLWEKVSHPSRCELTLVRIDAVGWARLEWWRRFVSHLVFKAKTRCSSYVCPGSSCHTYGQNVSTEYQCLYYIVSYYKNLLQVEKGLNSGMDPILPQAVDRGFRTPRRNLHQRTPQHSSNMQRIWQVWVHKVLSKCRK
jgi:hypothetical protein